MYGTQAGGGAFGQGTLFGLLNIEVANRPPVPVILTSPNPAEAVTVAGATVTLNGRGSWDADYDDLSYAWSLPFEASEIQQVDPGDPSAITATFPASATPWQVTLTVGDGLITRSITVSVVVTDGPPVFSDVAPISTPATGPGGATVSYPLPTATDLVDGDRPVDCSPASGSLFPVGVTTVECSAADLQDNEATVTFKVTITPAVLINVPAAMTVEATSDLGAIVNYTVSATAGSGAPLLAPCDRASGDMFAIGTTTVNCSANDTDTGVTATASFDVNVVDTMPPVITMDINGIEYNSEGPNGAVVQYDDPTRVLANDSPSAFDVVDGSVEVDCTPPPGPFPLGRTHVTCTAIDDAGNESEFRFDIVVRDSDDPVLTLPGTMIVEAQNPAGALVEYDATATDLTSPDGLTVNCTPATNTTFALGSTTVTCTATDGAGSVPESQARSSTGSFVVTVVDTTVPVLSVPPPITREATGPTGAVVTYSVTASDSASVPTVSCLPASNSTFPLGTTMVQCSALDGSGNKAAASFAVNVTDTIGPVITVPANIGVVTASATGTPVTYSVSATDLVDGPRPVSCSPVSGSVFLVGLTTVNCESLDAKGNLGTASFTVTVATTPPTLRVTLSPGVLWPPNHRMVTINATITATSEVGGTPIVTLVSIESNEPDNGLGDGDTANDIQDAMLDTDDRTFQLRAERNLKGTGRIYTVTYKAVNTLNPAIFTLTTATVTVPHDMRDKTN